jgi:hypothetical protein
MRLGTSLLRSQNVAWTANSTKKIELPQDRYVRAFGLTVKGVVDTAGSAPVADGLLKGIISRARIIGQMSGSPDVLVDVNVDRYFKMRSTLFATPWYFDNVDTTSQTDWARRFDLPFDFAINPADEFDFSAVVPAQLMTSLICELDLPANNVVTNMTAKTTTTIEPWVKELFLTPQEEADFLKAGQRKVYVNEVSTAVSSTTDYGTLTQNLPLAVVVQRMGIFTYNGSSVLTDNIISRYRIQDNVQRATLDEFEWCQSVYEDKRRYALEKGNLVAGMTIYDAEQSFPGLIGLPMIGRKKGDVTFDYIGTATGTAYLVFEQVV